MSDMNASEGHDGKADMAYGNCPYNIINKKSLPYQLFIESW